MKANYFLAVVLSAICIGTANAQPARVTAKGTPVELNGTLPHTGTPAPDFTGVDGNMKDIRLSDFKGKRIVLNIFPSLDTPTCALSVRRFNEMAASLPSTQVLAVSMDLPFAQKRFCSTEGIGNVTPLSVFRNPEFARQYGMLQMTGPGRGLLARAVVVIDEEGNIAYTQLVQEISEEPDYAAVMDFLKNM